MMVNGVCVVDDDMFDKLHGDKIFSKINFEEWISSDMHEAGR